MPPRYAEGNVSVVVLFAGHDARWKPGRGARAVERGAGSASAASLRRRARDVHVLSGPFLCAHQSDPFGQSHAAARACRERACLRGPRHCARRQGRAGCPGTGNPIDWGNRIPAGTFSLSAGGAHSQRCVAHCPCRRAGGAGRPERRRQEHNLEAADADLLELGLVLREPLLRRMPVAFLRSQIGLVQQEPFLFNGTVRENLLYGNLAASHDDVVAAAKAARAHEFIVNLPEGYDTWIGERGVKLSVGQRQRVSIARVLLKDPPIVMFDEATSNIDTETEVKIREALDELTKGRTTIVIAHRLSTVHGMDRIIVVDHGHVVEDGPHEVLMARGGLYAGLYEAQFQI